MSRLVLHPEWRKVNGEKLTDPLIHCDACGSVFHLTEECPKQQPKEPKP